MTGDAQIDHRKYLFFFFTLTTAGGQFESLQGVTELLHRNIHLTLTLKSLCMNKLKGDGEELINNRHRNFPTTYGSLAIIDLYFVISF